MIFAAADSRSTKLVAILCMLGGAIGFVIHDAVIKGLSGGYPLHQITFMRGLVGTSVTLLVFLPFEGGISALRTPRWRFHLLRGFLVVAANMSFYVSLATLPIGEATAIYFVAPLVITALSAFLLGEHVGPRRWAAVLVGLAGVILVIRPGASAFQIASLLPLLSAFCYGGLQVLTRSVGMREKAVTMAFYMQLALILFSAGMGLAFGNGAFAGSSDPSVAFLLRGWIWPPVHDLAILVLLGLISSVSAYMFVQAYRLAEAGLVAPFEYVAMPIAIVFGIVFWGDWPAPVAWGGIALIAASGLYVFFRETVLGGASETKKPRPGA